MADPIPFTRGVPSADMLPVDDFRRALADAMEREPAVALSYSTGGHPGLRRWIGDLQRPASAEEQSTVNGPDVVLKQSTSDDLQIEARLQPNDIDQVRTGQQAYVRFSAFNQRVTPQLAGQVSYVSADISHDQQTNAPYFTVRVMLPDDERRRLAGLQLVSGMPAEVFMQTGSRTMFSYLFKPIFDQLQRAFVER